MLAQLKKFQYNAWAIFIVCAGLYAFVFGLRVLSSVITIEGQVTLYKVGSGQWGNFSSFYFVLYGVAQIVVGYLLDSYSPRKLMGYALVLCLAGMVVVIVGQVAGVILLGRLVVVMSSAFFFIGVLKLASQLFLPQVFGKIVGITIAFGLAAAVVADKIAAFYVVTEGWGILPMVIMFVGLVFFFGFMTLTQQRKQPLAVTQKLPFTLKLAPMRQITVWMLALISCFLFMPVAVFSSIWGLHYLQQTHLLQENAALWLTLLLYVGLILGVVSWGWFSDSINQRCLPLTAGVIIVTILVAVIIFTPNLNTNYLPLLFATLGFFTGSIVLCYTLVNELVGDTHRALALGLINFGTMIGGMIYEPFFGVVMSWCPTGRIVNGNQYYSIADFQLVLFALPLCLIASAIMAFFLREPRAV